MASKFNLNQLMNEKSKSESGKDAIAFKVDLIPIDKIEPSKMNKYSVDDVEELKLSIELTGLQQNLLVRQRDGADTYELISGHRRFKAIQELNAAGIDNFNYIPCKIVKSVDDIQAELQLIFANSTSRRLTDFEITYQAARLKELLTELKKGGFKFTGRTREVVAELLHVSPSQIGRMESINNNLSPELKDEFRQGNINITTAYELSKLDGDQQERALEDHKSGVTLSPEKVKKRKEKPQEQQPPETSDNEIMDGQINLYGDNANNEPKTVSGEQIKTPLQSNEPPVSEPTGAAQEKREPEAVASVTPQFKIDHKLKIYPDEFNAVKSGLKTFEYRLNDKDYKTGDILSLCEYLPEAGQYTGEYINVKVIYMLNGGKFGVPVGYVIMSIVKLNE